MPTIGIDPVPIEDCYLNCRLYRFNHAGELHDVV